MTLPLLIYCGGYGRQYAQVAVDSGLLYGCRSDMRPHYPVTLADLNWRKPDRERHAAFVAEHQPHLAVAPDVLDLTALPETLRYAERLAAHARRVLIVPKVPGTIERLPRVPWLMLGYSVPSKYGGADGLLLWELTGWDVHLLGGNPMRQLELARYLRVYSADGNATQKAARWGVYYDADRNQWQRAPADEVREPGHPYRVFARSCQEVQQAWQRLYAEKEETPGE